MRKRGSFILKRVMVSRLTLNSACSIIVDSFGFYSCFFLQTNSFCITDENHHLTYRRPACCLIDPGNIMPVSGSCSHNDIIKLLTNSIDIFLIMLSLCFPPNVWPGFKTWPRTNSYKHVLPAEFRVY